MLVAASGFAAAFGLIFMRVPIAVALGIIGFVGYWLINDLRPALSVVALSATGGTMAYSLAVIPLFILMGNLVAGAGISAELYRAAQVFVGHRRGGLGIATILSCGGFAAVCGSSVATAVTMGRVAIPSMRSYGYSDRLATATVAAGGTLGILIPPSVIMVIYGIATESHIGMLFAAGLIPGIIGIIGYAAAVRWTAIRDPGSAPRAPRASRAEKIDALKRIWSVVALFGLVLGGIYGGLFTATEASGIGAMGALAFAIGRGVTFRQLVDIFRDSAETTAILFGLIIGATVFSEFINYTGAHEGILSLVRDSGLSPGMVILVIMLIYIVLGCVLDSLAMMLLTLPMFFPIVTGLGFDPIWFGIMVVMVVELGLITPPMGMNLFVLRTIVPDVSLATMIRGIVPFVVADLGRLLLLGLFPGIVMFLPNLLF